MNNFLSTPAAAPPPVNQQADGTQTNMGTKPTKASLNDRTASPNMAGRSGIEAAMGAQADKLHPPKFSGRR